MALKSFFTKGGNKTASPPARPLSGDETTIAPSPTAGSLADEKMQPTTTAIAPESRPASHDGGYVASDQNKGVQAAEKKIEQEDDDEEDDDTEYPSGMKLALISIALCLSVFCMVSCLINLADSVLTFLQGPRQHHHNHSHPTHHRSIQVNRRHWLVRLVSGNFPVPTYIYQY
jgi:hypothetical protein